MPFGISQGLLQNMMGNQQPQNNSFGNSYLNTGQLDPNKGRGSWEDYVRQLQFSQLENVANFNSPLYQQYAKFLQKNNAGMGFNNMLGMLAASGTGYAGGQNAANQRMRDFNLEKQDNINNQVGTFANNMQGQVQGLLGGIGQSFQNTMNRVSQEDMFNAQNSGIGAVTNAIGSIGALAAAPFTGGASLLALAGQAGGGTAGYKPQPANNNNNNGYAPNYWSGGGNPMNPWMRK